MKGGTFTRREVLAAGVATATLPAVALAQQPSDPAAQEATNMKVRFTFGDQTMTAALYDNPSARDFYGMLPLQLKISDFAHNEKIAYLPRKLTEEGSGPFGNEQPYDLCYYVPWGNLAMFYAAYRHPGLIRLGRFDSGQNSLHVRGEFSLAVEAI